MDVKVTGSGMPVSPPAWVVWRKSRYSNPSGNCVEVAELPAGKVAVRDSRDPGGPVLIFRHAEWAVFLLSARGSPG